MLWSGQGFAEAVNGNNLDPTSMPSSSLTPRRIMLVPLPLIIQRFLKVASDSVPTLTLLSFVVIQFLLNIVHYIPAMSFKKWADRSRLVLKSLLDSDYRWEYHQIETLRQRIADLERKNAAYAQEIELAREEQLVLRERLVKQSQDYEPQASTQDAEIKRLMRQLEAQGKLLEETEGLLEALRASETKKRSQFISEEKATYLEKIGALEGRIATLTTERQDAAEEIRKIQESHQSLQQQFDAVDAEKQDVLGRLTAAERREEQLRKDSEVLSVKLSRGTEERDAIHQNLTTEKESLEKEVHDLVIVGQDMEKQLLQAQQELAAAQAQSYTSSILNHQLQGKIKALEGAHIRQEIVTQI
ncbi:hypothetical protein FRC15_003919 [Serendipita sp. 397]|nr:hypothetical protein FRC15_003919 [Serendipita sp. 397]